MALESKCGAKTADEVTDCVSAKLDRWGYLSEKLFYNKETNIYILVPTSASSTMTLRIFLPGFKPVY